ncbi:hypothetical protein L7F22_012503 [Adiantum nelumboides]|nr:hypothetical protein [Adiantum nelumboides]
MHSLDYKRSYEDHVYVKRQPNGQLIILILYVDDMLIASHSKKDIADLKTKLKSKFDMKELGEANLILVLQRYIPLHEHAPDPDSARRESICKGKLLVRSSRKQANEAVRLIEASTDAVEDDLHQALVSVMAEREYNEERNVLTDEDLVFSTESSSASDDVF